MIDDCVFILINLYNSNTDREQVSIWEKMNLILETFNDLENKIIIVGCDFYLFLDSALEVSKLLFQNSLKLKKHTTYVTFGALEIQKKNLSQFDKNIAQVFCQEEFFFFISNTLQKSIEYIEILLGLFSDHFQILFSLVSTKLASKGKGLWKFKNFLFLNVEFVPRTRETIFI